jgi:hypothetical protein
MVKKIQKKEKTLLASAFINVRVTVSESRYLHNIGLGNNDEYEERSGPLLLIFSLDSSFASRG